MNTYKDEELTSIGQRGGEALQWRHILTKYRGIQYTVSMINNCVLLHTRQNLANIFFIHAL